MRIVQISTNQFPLPPPHYGGIERVIFHLSNRLATMGHEVIAYAKAGSKINGKVIEYPANVRNMEAFIKRTLPSGVDIIHDHVLMKDVHFGVKAPTIHTVHINTDVPMKHAVYVSQNQLNRLKKGRGTFIHHGIELDDYPLSLKKKDYLLFLGRIVDFKGTHTAINVARKTGLPLIIAGIISERGKQYHKTKIAPRIDQNQIKYIGPVGGQEKMKLLSEARAVLFPSTANETFGLVPIEALACGTPAFCFYSGALKETMQGIPELLCKNEEEMIRKVKSGGFPKPETLREYVSKRFTAEIMTQKYLNLYQKLLK
ncbi:glycosyltransferase [Halobacillus yeomjeoni]|uniref:Glycosyltransferase n=1 Tax=Halobacillus yeomjeoni TaxID=311194 RepID=A0A931HWZ4_9BACI|nr:glycosyltransferase [Halobacillus yeomjeoni]MBH0231392.1 glycosyltransferase [Halobacillus yeomjeoni]